MSNRSGTKTGQVHHELIKDIKPALKRDFTTYTGTADLYVYFYELGYELLKDGGMLGYITSNKWMRAGYGRKLRTFIKDKTALARLIDLGEAPLFQGATTYTNIIIFKKQTPPDNNRIIVSEAPFGGGPSYLDQALLGSEVYQLEAPIFYQIKHKMEAKGKPLGDWDVKINRGITTGFNDAFIIDSLTKDRLIRANPKSTEVIKPFLRGRDINRWYVQDPGLWLIFIPSGWTNANRGNKEASTYFEATYPRLYQHIKSIGDTIKGRGKGLYNRDDQGDYWWELRPCKYCNDFEDEKIVWSKTASDSQFSYDSKGFYQNNTSHYLISDDAQYLAAILNSKLTYWYLDARGSLLRGGYLEFVDWLVKLMPIPQIDKADQEPFVALSDQLHTFSAERYKLNRRFLHLLQEEFKIAKPGTRLGSWHTLSFGDFITALKAKKVILTGQTKEDWFERFHRLKAEIQTLDTQIAQAEQELNNRVNTLYGLTDEEVAFMKQSLLNHRNR